MSTPNAPFPVPEFELRRRDTEIVIAVFRTIFLLVVLFSQQFMQARGTGAVLLAVVVIAAALYNLALFVLHVRGLPFPRIIIVSVDVVLVSLWIHFCGPQCAAYFTLYYAIVIVAGLWFGVSGAFLTAIFASALYVWAVLTSRQPEGGVPGGTVLLQISFLIITAGVISIAAEAQARERQALASSRMVLQEYRERIRVAQYVDDLVRPKRLLVAPGLDIGFQYRPAAMAFSGDYYDLIPLGGRRWGLCVADLSGHFSQRIGYLSTFKTTLRLTARREQSPARVLTEINREVSAAIADNVEFETFISMSYVVVDLDAATLTYANAGHEPPVLIHAAGDGPVDLTLAGMVLGVLPEVVYREETLPVSQADTLVLFTDGMTEVQERRGRFLGREGFLAMVRQHLHSHTAEEMSARIFHEVNEYGKEGQHRDDMTLLIARITAPDLGLPREPEA